MVCELNGVKITNCWKGLGLKALLQILKFWTFYETINVDCPKKLVSDGFRDF